MACLETFNAYLTEAMNRPAMDVTEIAVSHYPYKDLFLKTHNVNSVIRGIVTDKDGDQHLAIVSFGHSGVSYGEPEKTLGFEVWCGDRFFEGKDEALKETDPLFVHRRLVAALSDNQNLNAFVAFDMQAQHGKSQLTQPGPKCSFWRDFRNSRGAQLCDHTYAFLRWLQENRPDFKQELMDHFDSKFVRASADADLKAIDPVDAAAVASVGEIEIPAEIRDAYDIRDHAATSLFGETSWSAFSKYFMFLTLQAGGCSKIGSGALSVLFPSFWKAEGQSVSVELGGYDSYTLGRHAVFSAHGPDAEAKLRIKLLEVFEQERLAILAGPPED